jgi:hypothetical protein
MKHLDDFLGIYDDAFTPSVCKEFIEYIDLMEKRSLLMKMSESSHTQDDLGLNFSHCYNLKSWSWIGESFFPTIKPYISEYINKFSILTEANFMLLDLKVKKIEQGAGFHRWHYENACYASLDRFLVIQVYLNTIEEGGETEFLYLNRRVKAEQGRLLIFPSGFTHTHRGNPPIGEDKYILTSWVLLQE